MQPLGLMWELFSSQEEVYARMWKRSVFVEVVSTFLLQFWPAILSLEESNVIFLPVFCIVGVADGRDVGLIDGSAEGIEDGIEVGNDVGISDGNDVGATVGKRDGRLYVQGCKQKENKRKLESHLFEPRSFYIKILTWLVKLKDGALVYLKDDC